MNDTQRSTSVTIRHLPGSSLGGTAQVFAEEVILIGRGEDNDVPFDPLADRQVSTCHARITRRGGTLTLTDLGSTNGTYVNGVRLEGGRDLIAGDIIRLGETGPEFMAFLGEGDNAAIPATIAQTRGGVHAATGRAPIPIGPGPIRVPIGGSGQSGPRPGSVTSTTSPVRKGRMRAVLALVFLLAMGGAGYAWYNGNLGTVSIGGLNLGAFSQQNEDSVYLVILEYTKKDGTVGITPIGTAWVVEEGVLATNAHVVIAARELFNKFAGSRVFARSNTDLITDISLDVEESEIHPAYTIFTEMMLRYAASRVKRDGTLPNPYDVGIFRVKPSQSKQLEQPLKLAIDERLYRINAGMEVASVGFPSEGLSGGGTNIDRPVASYTQGTINKMTDFFLGRTDPVDAIVLTYQFVSAGGASGSPVYDSRGLVIGLIASGNVVAKTNAGRIAVGGTTYGPRVDVLRELLDGTAKDKLEQRESEWRREFEHYGKG